MSLSSDRLRREKAKQRDRPASNVLSAAQLAEKKSINSMIASAVFHPEVRFSCVSLFFFNPFSLKEYFIYLFLVTI